MNDDRPLRPPCSGRCGPARTVAGPSYPTVSLEGRANGATYTGYLVVRDLDTSNNQEHLVAIPARAYVQAPGSISPVTWVRRLEDAS